MFRRPAASGGGALLGADLVAHGIVVYHPAGGTHHGLPDRASGFCYFNDPVLAILALQRHGLKRIAYVDIDAHHCDGVDVAFRDHPDVLLVSLHEEGRWPFTGAVEDEGAGNIFNLPIPKGCTDEGFDLALSEVILPAVTRHRPDVIVLQCGADGVLEDPLSRLAWSNNCHWTAVRALREIAPRFLVLGGGGYNPWSVGRLWSGLWAVLNGHEIPDRLPAAGEAVLRGLTWRRRAGQTPPPHWFTTLKDTPRYSTIDPALRHRVQYLSKRLCAPHPP